MAFTKRTVPISAYAESRSKLHTERNDTVKAVLNVCETDNSPIGENLEMFSEKVMKKFSLPSLRPLLSSGKEYSATTSLQSNPIEKSHQETMKKYAQNDYPYINRRGGFTCLSKGRTSSSLKGIYENSQEDSISDMFSDGLSDPDDYGNKLSFVAGSDVSETESLPPVIVLDGEEELEAGSIPRENKRAKFNQITDDSGKTPSNFCSGISNFPQGNPKSNKQQRETAFNSKLGHSLSLNSDTASLLYNSIDQSPLPRIQIHNQNHGVFGSQDKNLMDVIDDSDLDEEPFLPAYSNYTEMEGHSTSGGPRNSENLKHELSYVAGSVESDSDFESPAINIARPLLNLNARTIESTNTDRQRDVVEDNLVEKMLDLSPEIDDYKSNFMKYRKKEQLELSDLFKNIEKNSAVEFVYKNNTCQQSFDSQELSGKLLTDTLENIGSPRSDYSSISLTPLRLQSNSPEIYPLSFEAHSPSYSENGRTMFHIPQAMYIKQRNSFLKQHIRKCERLFTFKLSNSVAKDVQQSQPESQPSVCLTNGSVSPHSYNDSDMENEISYLPTQYSDNNHYTSQFVEISTRKWNKSNPINTKKRLKRSYPFDKRMDLGDAEIMETESICENVKETFTTIDTVQYMPMNPSPSVNADENAMEFFSSNSFRRVSHNVTNFVGEWLNCQNGGSTRQVNRGHLPLKRRRLNLYNEMPADNSLVGENNTFAINPKMLLANYSCEYSEAHKKHFEPI